MYEDTSCQCADIYTKPFTDAAKWVAACDLINVIDLVRLKPLMKAVEVIMTTLLRLGRRSRLLKSLTGLMVLRVILMLLRRLLPRLSAGGYPVPLALRFFLTMTFPMRLLRHRGAVQNLLRTVSVRFPGGLVMLILVN